AAEIASAGFACLIDCADDSDCRTEGHGQWLYARTVQNMPERLRRDPITVLHPASITPGPTDYAWGTWDSAFVRHCVRSSSPRSEPPRPTPDYPARATAVWLPGFDLADIQRMLMGHYPPPFRFLVVGMKFAAEIPEVLASVIEI